MHINGHGSNTLPASFGGRPPAAASRNACTLPATARPGSPRRASAPAHETMATGGVTYPILYFFASRERRASMHAARVEIRLGDAMQRFVGKWSQRQIDDLTPRDGAKLLGAACKRAPVRGGELEPSVLTRILHRCLAAVQDPVDLLMLYKDLTAAPSATRALAEGQTARLRPVADGILDALEQALAEALSTSIGKSLFDRLLKAARCTPGNAQEVGKALEQLQGIGLWLAVPARPAAHVLARMLDIVSDQELGQLAAQAWPELAVQDECYGAEPAEMRAAVAFINTCDGQ
ncbi:MAG TPA: hypothetical protein VL522_02580, partial [Bordetella sp.]|nr:hypothetical protein [Bordetella sp.]